MELLVYVLILWFFFYLINYSLIFEAIRKAAMPALPQWMQTLLSCAFCAGFWATVALSLFTGFTPAVFAAPPCMLFVDLVYRKLSGATSDKFPEDFPSELHKTVQAAVHEEIKKQSRSDGFLSHKQDTNDNPPPILK